MSDISEKTSVLETAQVDNSNNQNSDNEASQTSQNSELLLFFSFDIVNSTQYKSVTTKWPIILKNLLEEIRNQISNSTIFSNCSLWRVIGDELIFVVPVYTEEELPEIVDEIFRTEQIISFNLKSGSFFDNINSQVIDSTEIEILKSQNMLAIKVAAWIAPVKESEATNPYDNIRVIYSPNSLNRSIVDFLGKDIDAGFRLKEYSYRNQMAISVELAYLLTKGNNHITHLHIMDYVSLKGVWNNELYPIIWYFNAANYGLSKGEVTFDTSFRYDDINENKLIHAYSLRNKHPGSYNDKLNPDMYESSFLTFDKIITDQGLSQKMNYLSSVLNYESFPLNPQPNESDLELHCAVVCCDTAERKIFITHRNNMHTTNPQKWEFGCAKANNTQSLSAVICDYYHKVYGLRIKLVLNEERDESQPLPIAVYEIASTPGGSIPKKGIIFVAEVEKKPSSSHNTTKHDQFQWISEAEISTIKPEEAIPDFHNTLKYVFEHFDELFNLTKGVKNE